MSFQFGEPDTYEIHIQRPDLRRFVWRRWWATATVGVFKLGEAGSGVWRARSRGALIDKATKALRRDALRRGITEPVIKVDDSRVEDYWFR